MRIIVMSNCQLGANLLNLNESVYGVKVLAARKIASLACNRYDTSCALFTIVIRSRWRHNSAARVSFGLLA